MPISPYNNETTSRFNPIKNWAKVLFRPDKKLQTTEIIEVQDFLNNQIAKAFETLYKFYTITKGCKVIVEAITSTGYSCILTPGQVYIELKKIGSFVDLPSHTFNVSRTESTFIGVVFETQIAQDLDDYKNPHSGGAAFGSEGADRLLIKPIIITSTKSNPYLNGFYPIAIIKPKSSSFITSYEDIGDGRPDIIYYRNEELTSVFNQRVISTHIKNLIELRLYETSGDFIDKGLQLSFNNNTNILTISPGVAYVKGQRIQTNYNYFFKFNGYSDIAPNNLLPINYNYLVYLNKKGNFNIIQSSNQDSFIAELPTDSIALGILILKDRNNITLNTEYEILSANNIMPSVLDLIKLEQSFEENKKQLAQLALDINLYKLSKNKGVLNGLVVDSFVNLKGSDIFAPEFNASILPAIQAISMPFISFARDNRNINIEESTDIIFSTKINEDKQQVLYWSTVNGTEQVLLSQKVITGFINIPNYSPNSLMLSASPNIIYKSDAATLVNYTHPDIKLLTGLEQAVVINTPFNDNVYTRPVIFEATGFNSLQDNIQLSINNINIRATQLLEGAFGSTNSTLKASSSGNLKFIIDIPEIQQAETYVVSLNSGFQEASTEIKIIDPELSRTDREINSNFIIKSPPKYSSVQSGILQTFILDLPVILTGVDLFIADKPAITKDTLLNVYIVNLNANGLPTDEAIGYGSINNSFSLTGENLVNIPLENRPISSATRILLDKPINLTKRGVYGLIVQTNLPSVSLFVNKVGQPSLINGVISNKSNLYQGRLYSNSNGEWSELSDTNITFNLISHRPLSITSSTILNVRSLEGQEFDVIDINLPIDLDISSFLTIYVKDSNNNFKLIQNGSYFFDTPVLSSDIKIDMRGTSYTHPILELDNIQINLIQTKDKCTWVSTNQSFETPYSNIKFSLDIFKPNSAQYKFYFSSNKGKTWEEINETDNDTSLLIEEVNKNIPLNKYTFTKNNLGFTTVDNEVSFRYDLKLKVEIIINNKDGIYPFFKNLIVITDP